MGPAGTGWGERETVRATDRDLLRGRISLSIVPEVKFRTGRDQRCAAIRKIRVAYTGTCRTGDERN
jgi:hypothetical protein